MNQEKNKGGRPARKKAHPQHKVWDLICAVPRETLTVRNDLMALGLSKDKYLGIRRNDREFISRGDEMVLIAYFKQFPFLYVRTIEDLYYVQSTDDLMRSYGMSKSKVSL
jgi:hypothetical protein